MGTNMLDVIQSELAKTPCPYCRKRELDLRLRCDLLSDGECLFIVKCGSCETNYAIGLQTKQLASHQPIVEDLLSALTCSTCASTKTELGFACDLTSKACFYTITCKSCGTAIKEYR
jgi:hypothetical protein